MSDRFESDIRDVLERLTAIETKLDDRDRRLLQVEGILGRNGFITTAISGVTAAIILTVKYLVDR